MELTQQEIQWIKEKFAEENSFTLAKIKHDKIDKARDKVAKKYEKELKKLADEGKIEERKALIEKMAKEADEAERNIAN